MEQDNKTLEDADRDLKKAIREKRESDRQFQVALEYRLKFNPDEESKHDLDNLNDYYNNKVIERDYYNSLLADAFEKFNRAVDKSIDEKRKIIKLMKEEDGE